MEQLLERRYEVAWLVLGWNPSAVHSCEMSMVYDNWIKDGADRYPKSFKFDGMTGWVDFESDSAYVTWGGMGIHLESLGTSKLREAIRQQIGY